MQGWSLTPQGEFVVTIDIERPASVEFTMLSLEILQTIQGLIQKAILKFAHTAITSQSLTD